MPSYWVVNLYRFMIILSLLQKHKAKPKNSAESMSAFSYMSASLINIESWYLGIFMIESKAACMGKHSFWDYLLSSRIQQ